MTAAGFSPIDQPIYRVCSRAIAGAGALVPASQREDWRREWEAELWHRVHLLDRVEQLTLAAQLDLLLRCLGSFRHAAWLRGRDVCGRRSLRAMGAALGEIRATPAASSATILVLAFALGTGSMVFGMAWDALQLPGHLDADSRVVRIWNRAAAAEMDRSALSQIEFTRLQTGNRTLDRIAAFRRGNLLIEGDDGREVVGGARVTADFFRVFGQRLALGSEPGAVGGLGETGVVLGHDLWQRRFRGDPRIVGRRVVIEGLTYRVNGVAAPGFRFPRDQAQLWLPLSPTPELASPGERMLVVVGLLRSGVSRADAQIDLTRLSLELQRELPATYFGRFHAHWDVVVAPLADAGYDLKPILLLLLGAAILTALAGAAGSAALAGNRGRFSSCPAGALYPVVCTGTAVAVGLACCAGGLRLATPLTAAWLPGLVTPTVGLPAAGLLLFGGVLALAGMRATARHQSAAKLRPRRHTAAIVLAGVIGIVLIAVGTGYERSYRRLRDDGPGFRDGHLLVLPPAASSSQMERWRDRMRGLPGVEGVTLATNLPYVQGTNTSTFERADLADSLRLPPTTSAVQLVDSAYFDVLGIPILEGRRPAPNGTEAVVSGSMARRFWPGAQAVGQRIQVYLSSATPSVPVTVVGVVGDVRRVSLNGPGIAELYLPRAVEPDRVPSLALRSTLTPDQLAAALGGADELPHMLVMSEWVARAGAPYRIAAVVLGALALVAALSVAVACRVGREVSAG